MFHVSCRYGGPVDRERTGYDFQLSSEFETAVRIMRWNPVSSFIWIVAGRVGYWS